MRQEQENGTLQSAASNVVKFPQNNRLQHNTPQRWREPKSLQQALNTCLFWQTALSDLDIEFLIILASIPTEHDRLKAIVEYKTEIRLMLNKCRKYAGGEN